SDRTVRLWDVKTRRARATLQGHKDLMTWVAFSPDGLQVFSWDQLERVLAWTVRDGKPVPALQIPAYASRWLVVSPAGGYRAELRGNVIFLTDLARAARERAARRTLEAVNRPYWHQEQAGRAEQDKDWFAAAFHLRQLRRDRPEDVDLLQRYVQVLAKLGR